MRETSSTSPTGLTDAGDQRRRLFPDVARSELAKLATVRSTYLMLTAAVGLIVAAAVLLCEAYVHHLSAQLSMTQLDFNPTSYSLSGVLIAQLVVGTLGILLYTSEHATGLIRVTFAAVPQRRLVLAAKAVVFSVVTLLITELACFAAFGIGQAILSTAGADVALTDPGVLRAVVGAGLYLTLLGLMSLGIGVLVRHSTGALAVLFGLLLLLPSLTEGLPARLGNAVNPYLPSYAGQAIFHTVDDTHLLPPWQGFFVFCVYTAVTLAAAFAVIGRQDT